MLVVFAMILDAVVYPDGDTAALAFIVELKTCQPVAPMLPEFKIKFVRDSSRSKPLGASVTGSWSKRGVSAGTTSTRPCAFTRVAVLALANELLTNVTGAEATNGTHMLYRWLIPWRGAPLCATDSKKNILGRNRLR